MTRTEALEELRYLIRNIQTGATNEQEAIQIFLILKRYI